MAKYFVIALILCFIFFAQGEAKIQAPDLENPVFSECFQSCLSDGKTHDDCLYQCYDGKVRAYDELSVELCLRDCVQSGYSWAQCDDKCYSFKAIGVVDPIVDPEIDPEHEEIIIEPMPEERPQGEKCITSCMQGGTKLSQCLLRCAGRLIDDALLNAPTDLANPDEDCMTSCMIDGVEYNECEMRCSGQVIDHVFPEPESENLTEP
mmetsp:Transcript_18758/g.21213  ORF Transcript_18758/g.21213 Transcript_18758/m.21213 type:complete len:207 (+) Transcript_18758:51-671(+)